MRLRNIPRANEEIEASSFVVHQAKEMAGKWKEVFGNSNPIHIEVGMGKGQFLLEMAKQHPNINYVGMEKYTSVLLRALEKRQQESEVTNLLFLCENAEDLPEIFVKGEVAKIYLNFSDPWPKERHARRRLPSKEFLARYDLILDPQGRLEFKTDNRGLFEFALEQTEEAGWILEAHTFDLHNHPEMAKGNVMTEYEQKFSAKGNPIHKLISYRQK